MSCFQLFNLKGGGLGNQCRALIIKVKHTFFLLSFVAVNDEGTENVDFQCGVRGVGVGCSYTFCRTFHLERYGCSGGGLIWCFDALFDGGQHKVEEASVMSLHWRTWKASPGPELRVRAAGGFEGSCRAGRWLHWCHIIHSAWPLYF